MLLRLVYLTATNAFAVLRLLPMGDRDKDAEILALGHQIAVLERQLGREKARFTSSDRAFLAALLYRLPPEVVRGYVFTVIEHANRHIRVLGATAHPTTSWVVQVAKNLVMDLENAGSRARLLIRGRDGK